MRPSACVVTRRAARAARPSSSTWGGAVPHSDGASGEAGHGERRCGRTWARAGRAGRQRRVSRRRAGRRGRRGRGERVCWHCSGEAQRRAARVVVGHARGLSERRGYGSTRGAVHAVRVRASRLYAPSAVRVCGRGVRAGRGGVRTPGPAGWSGRSGFGEGGGVRTGSSSGTRAVAWRGAARAGGTEGEGRRGRAGSGPGARAGKGAGPGGARGERERGRGGRKEGGKRK